MEIIIISVVSAILVLALAITRNKLCSIASKKHCCFKDSSKRWDFLYCKSPKPAAPRYRHGARHCSPGRRARR